MGINKTWPLIPLVMPQNWHLANYSNHATIRMMSLWKRTTKRLVHMQHARDAGGIKVVTLHKFTMEPTKEYNNHEDSTSQNIQIYNTKIQIIHKANSIRVRTRIQMGLRGLKINDGIHNPAQAKPEG
jgi:hypothetical protein